MNLRSLLIAGLLLNGCSEPIPEKSLPEVIWEGEYLQYGTFVEDEELCEGTLPFMDRQIVALAERFGLPPNEVLFARTVELGDSCDVGEACTASTKAGPTIFSPIVPHTHEMVHAVRGQVDWSQSLFEEGVAVYLDARWSFSSRRPYDIDMDELLRQSTALGEVPIDTYVQAGLFVNFVHSRGSHEVLDALLFETDISSPYEDTIKVVENAAGVTWNELLAEYEAQPVCTQEEYRSSEPLCQDPVFDLFKCVGPQKKELAVDLRCDSELVVGEIEDAWTYASFTVERDGEFALSVSETDVPTVNLRNCSGGCSGVRQDLTMPTVPLLEVTELWLEAGTYLVEVNGPATAEPFTVDVVSRDYDWCE